MKGILVSGRQPEKSCEAHVSAWIIRQTHRITTPLLSTYSPGPREHVRYPFHIVMTSKSLSTRLFKKFSKFQFYIFFIKDFLKNYLVVPKRTLKIHEKTLEAHVSDKISRTTCRTIIPIGLEDRYDPWQVLWYLGYVLEPTRKFFQVDWSRLVFSVRPLFWVFLLNSSQNPLQIPSEPFWTLKNEP